MLKNVLQYSFKSLSFHAWIRLSNQGKKEGCRVWQLFVDLRKMVDLTQEERKMKKDCKGLMGICKVYLHFKHLNSSQVQGYLGRAKSVIENCLKVIKDARHIVIHGSFVLNYDGFLPKSQLVFQEIVTNCLQCHSG